jgi:hypothetical protein
MDWQSPGCELGSYNLVNLLAAFWTREQRQEAGREITLLRRYYNGLLSHGAHGYSGS